MQTKHINIPAMIEQAAKGRKCWIHFTEQFPVTDETVLLLPTEDDELNKCCLQNLYQFQSKEQKKCFILTISSLLYDTEKEKRSDIIFYKITKADADALIRFYQLYQFYDKLLIGATDLPSGNSIGTVIRQGLLDKKPAITAGIWKTKI